MSVAIEEIQKGRGLLDIEFGRNSRDFGRKLKQSLITAASAVYEKMNMFIDSVGTMSIAQPQIGSEAGFRTIGLESLNSIEVAPNPYNKNEWPNDLGLSESERDILASLNFYYDSSRDCFVRQERQWGAAEKRLLAGKQKDIDDSTWTRYTFTDERSEDLPPFIAIAGLGTAGSNLVLSETGLNFGGAIRLADPDRVDESNTVQQSHKARDLGVNKAIATARRMIQDDLFPGRVEVFPKGITSTNLEIFLEDARIVGECIDISQTLIATQLHQEAKRRGLITMTPIDLDNWVVFASRDYSKHDEKLLYLDEQNPENMKKLANLIKFQYAINHYKDLPYLQGNGISQELLIQYANTYSTLLLAEPSGPVPLEKVPPNIAKSLMEGNKVIQPYSAKPNISLAAYKAMMNLHETGEVIPLITTGEKSLMDDSELAEFTQFVDGAIRQLEDLADTLLPAGLRPERNYVFQETGLALDEQFKQALEYSQKLPNMEALTIQNEGNLAIRSFSEVVYKTYTERGFIGQLTDTEGAFPSEYAMTSKDDITGETREFTMLETPFLVVDDSFNMSSKELSKRICELLNQKGYSELDKNHFRKGKGIVLIDSDGIRHYIDAYTERSAHFQVVTDGKARMTARLTRNENNGLTTPSLDDDSIELSPASGMTKEQIRRQMKESEIVEFGHFGGDREAFLRDNILPYLAIAATSYSEAKGITDWFATIDMHFLDNIIDGRHSINNRKIGPPTFYMGSYSIPIIITPAKIAETMPMNLHNRIQDMKTIYETLLEFTVDDLNDMTQRATVNGRVNVDMYRKEYLEMLQTRKQQAKAKAKKYYTRTIQPLVDTMRVLEDKWSTIDIDVDYDSDTFNYSFTA